MADTLMGSGDALASGASAPEIAPSGPAPTSTVETPETSPETAADARVDAAPSGSDLDDEDEDVYDEEALVQDREKLRRLVKNARRNGRFAKENRALVRRIKDGNLDLDDLQFQARNHQALMARLQEEPELLQRVVTPPTAGRSAERGQPTPQARPEYVPLDIPDPPFDLSDEGGKYLHSVHSQMKAMHRQNWEFQQAARQTIRDLLQFKQGVETTQTSSSMQSMASTWKSEIAAVVEQFEPEVAELLESDLLGLQEAARRSGRPDVMANAKALIAKRMEQKWGTKVARFKKGTAPAAAITQAASQQRIAEQNRSRPNAAAFTGGQPAPARNRSTERLRDIRARKLGRHIPA